MAVLTLGQKQHFEVFGFLVLRRLFDEDEMATIREEAYSVFLEERQGRPFEGQERQSVYDLFTKRFSLDRVVDDDRIHGIA